MPTGGVQNLQRKLSDSSCRRWRPTNTKLLEDAKDLGPEIAGGYGMFINQVREQSELFADKELR